jgi:hypothetical protein
VTAPVAYVEAPATYVSGTFDVQSTLPPGMSDRQARLEVTREVCDNQVGVDSRPLRVRRLFD